MAIEYTWSIANLERNAEDGGVTVVHWRCEGTDGTNTGSAYGTVSCTPDASADGFIAFDSLTEADVLGWVHADVDKAATEEAIASKIDAQANPVSVAGLPW